MKTLSFFILASFFSAFCTGSILSAADWKVHVAKYRQDKDCATSYTFDDGLAGTFHGSCIGIGKAWLQRYILGMRLLYGTGSIVQIAPYDLGRTKEDGKKWA